MWNDLVWLIGKVLNESWGFFLSLTEEDVGTKTNPKIYVAIV
jgi:hypothetical protein